MASGEDDRLDIDWGSDICDICEDETWLTMVLYEPVRVISEQADGDEPLTHRHPLQQD